MLSFQRSVSGNIVAHFLSIIYLFIFPLISFIFLVSLNSEDCQGLSRAMWRQGPFLRDASTRQMGRAVKSTPPATPQPWRQYLRLLQRFHFCRRKGFEKFDGGNKGLAGGRLGKKRNLFLAGRRLTGLGVARILCKKESRKCDVNTSSPLFFRAKRHFLPLIPGIFFLRALLAAPSCALPWWQAELAAPCGFHPLLVLEC